MRPKWRLETRDTWDDGYGNPVETVAVFDDNRLDPWGKPTAQANVWWDGKQARCERCQGALSAMLTTCPHARAVKRIRPRESRVPLEGTTKAATERETQTWYRLSTYFDLGKIEERQVLKATEKTVTYLDPDWNGGKPTERREAKAAEWQEWFPSQTQAVARARALLTIKRDNLRRQAEHAAKALTAFNAAHPVEG